MGIEIQIANRPTNPEMIELGTLRPQAYFNVSKTLLKVQLSERHAQALIQTREDFTLNVPR